MTTEAQTWTETLPVPLTPQEERQRAHELVEAMQARDQARMRLSELSREIKAEVQEIEQTIARLAAAVRSGTEPRQVEVSEMADPGAGIVSVVRGDTGEVIRTRAMTPEERQETLPGVQSPTPPPRPQRPKGRRP